MNKKKKIMIKIIIIPSIEMVGFKRLIYFTDN